MYTVGTAGHVDHGKSTLIEALTGIDPDRLREEKERGMTIDLGFAWLTLPSGREISIVDVPGHERFVKNMLAGVGGIDAALLVVAADEGIMPQTREHLAILNLLGIRTGLVALTKKDLVDDEWIALLTEEIGDALKGTTLAGAKVIPVSALAKDGLDTLKAELDQLLEQTPAKRDVGRPRLPVDRVFSLGGFGTVVTGTLLDGSLALGQELEVLPAGLKTRARGLQSHKSKVEGAAPGRRVAVNLGGLATEDLQRGDVVTVPGALKPTAALDVKLRLLPNAPKPLANATSVSFHSGTAEAVGKVTLLEGDALTPGAEGWAQVRLRAPIAVAKGDLFIIRQLSPAVTLGGGQIVDPTPARRHRRRQPGVIAALDLLAQGTPEEIVLQTLELKEGTSAAPAAQEPQALLKASGLETTAAQEALAALEADGRVVRLGALVLTLTAWRRIETRAREQLAAYHRQFPLRPGMPREELKSRLQLPTRQFNDALARLTADGITAEAGAAVRLSAHEVALTPSQTQLADALVGRLEAQPAAPPTLPELRALFGSGGANGNGGALEEDLLAALSLHGRIVRVSEELAFSAAAYNRMVARLTEHLTAHGKITVAEARDLFGTSRKYVLPLLEHLDQKRVTRRLGDERVLMKQ
jgi:selenocysteine-specific elongation factor